MPGITGPRRTGRHAPTRSRRTARASASALIVALALTACGGEGGGLPTSLPTTLPSVTLPTLPTVTLPTLPSVTLPTLPTVTLPTLPELPTNTAEPSPEQTPEPTAEATDTPTAAPTLDEESPDEESPDDGGSGWLWWLLLAAAAAAAAAYLLRRRSQRAAWAEALQEPLREATWMRDSIVPNLLAQGPDGRSGIWAIGRPRTLTLEQSLATLAPQAPDQATARHVAALTAAVQALRRALDQADTMAGFGGSSTTAALQQSHHELDEAIRALQPPTQEGSGETAAATGARDGS